jgi:hypothetical protein
MAISKAELSKWLDSLPDNASIAVDEDGLSLVELTDAGLGAAYCEVGGVPLDQD